MANTGNDGQSAPDEAEKPGRIDALLASVGLRRKTKAEGNHVEERPGSDLVDQAEAFQTLRVSDVMTPRADITAIDIDASFEEVIGAFAESEHSRLPVYRQTLDDPVGVAHLKDLFKLLAKSRKAPAGEPVLATLKRETLYVPPSMRAADLLLRMQTSRIHMAIVIDEFGGVDGLVTLEDVIEAVVGEIDDEHDEAAVAQIVARAGGIFEVDARAALEDLEAAMDRSLDTEATDDEDIDTVAGLVTALAGRVPQRGEIIAHPAGLEFEITDADARRVKRLRVRPQPQSPTAAAAPDE